MINQVYHSYGWSIRIMLPCIKEEVQCGRNPLRKLNQICMDEGSICQYQVGGGGKERLNVKFHHLGW